MEATSEQWVGEEPSGPRQTDSAGSGDSRRCEANAGGSEGLDSFQEVVREEVEVAGYLGRYLELRSSGRTPAEAARELPGSDTKVGRRVHDMLAMVDMLIEARDAIEPPLR